MTLRHWPGHIVVIDSALLLLMPAVDSFHEGQAPLLLTDPEDHYHHLFFLLTVPSWAQMKPCKLGKITSIPGVQ